MHKRAAGDSEQREPVQDPSLSSRRPGEAGRSLPAVEVLQGNSAQRPGWASLSFNLHPGIYVEIFRLLSTRCLLRNPACSSASRGPPCRQPRPTQRRSCIGGWTSAPGCAISTRAGKWRKSISYARCVPAMAPARPSAFTFMFSPEVHALKVVSISSAFGPRRVELDQYSPVTHLSSPSLTLSKVCLVQK